MEIETNIK